MQAEQIGEIFQGATGQRPQRIEVMLRDGLYKEYQNVTLCLHVHMKDIQGIHIPTHHQQIEISVPLLKDQSEYGDWFDRACEQAGIEGSTLDYKEYELFQPLMSDGFNIYTWTGYVQKWNGDVLEQFFISEGTLNYFLMIKDVLGMAIVEGEGQLAEYILSAGDLYVNPGNTPIHSLGILLENPEGVYWGKDVYYNPNVPESILVNTMDEWLWMDANGIFKKMPEQIRDELLVINNIL